MPTAIELLRQGRKSQIWTKYCGFLDLNIEEFMQIQEHLLMEQVNLIANTEVGKHFMGDRIPRNIDEFRRTVPITCYEDYEAYFESKHDDPSYTGAYLWAHSSGRSGKFKWIPYTRDAFQRLGEHIMAGVILAMAREKGDVHLQEGDVLVYNTPPRPYISGVVLHALAEQFSFRFIPPLDETEAMSFEERIETGFREALETGIDVLGSISVVLVKMGEQFARGAQKTKFSANMLKPRVLHRLLRGYIHSKLEHRPMLPKDLWAIKALPCGGMDTSIYREKIKYFWGVAPFEQFGSTEEGTIATQAWNKKGMYFFPDACFLEFIPEDEWAKSRKNPLYEPQTVLLDEVETNQHYEMVLTSYFGKELLRYRTLDIIGFQSLEDPEAGIYLPQMTFVARAGDYIDLAGFTGLIDEKMVWQAIIDTGIEYADWAMRKETYEGNPVLHLYLETIHPITKDEVQRRVHDKLKAANPFYADYESMIAKHALNVTLLPPGTFKAYMLHKQSTGSDLAHLKPPHMNAPEAEINLLTDLGDQVIPG